eukprot:2302272-Prymnesium_polylepis.1
MCREAVAQPAPDEPVDVPLPNGRQGERVEQVGPRPLPEREELASVVQHVGVRAVLDGRAAGPKRHRIAEYAWIEISTREPLGDRSLGGHIPLSNDGRA